MSRMGILNSGCWGVLNSTASTDPVMAETLCGPYEATTASMISLTFALVSPPSIDMSRSGRHIARGIVLVLGAAFTGVEMGILQSIREVPGFLSFAVVFLLAFLALYVLERLVLVV